MKKKVNNIHTTHRENRKSEIHEEGEREREEKGTRVGLKRRK